MRGWLVALAAGTLATGALSGCGDSDSNNRDEPADSGRGGEAGSLAGSAGSNATAGSAGNVATGGAAGSAGGGGTSANGGSSGSTTDNGGEAGDGTDSGGEDPGGAPNAGYGGEDGGSSGAGAGSGGTATVPSTITRIREGATEKIDLLFMVDTSISMSDKQRIMAEAVPVLLARLVTPRCVDAEGLPTGEVTLSDGTCLNGDPEFPPVKDIHVGIVTSSLGHHGSADVCADTSGGRTPDDKAQLLGSVRTDLPGNASGFLTWQPGQSTGDFGQDFADQIAAAGELGCGYESSLEAWYRFLVDPEPVSSMSNEGSLSVRGATNATVLAQRADFLRSDSLLAIIMLTDENDCSIMDENQKQAWLVSYDGGPTASSWRMPQATASCAEANNTCCRPCIAAPAPGCPDNAAEACSETGYLPIANDSLNVRCFQQVQRFGIDFLYPTHRYASALRDTFIDPRMNGNLVRNPLFAPEAELPGRARDMVYLAGIIGVPWQDIATEDSLEDPRRLEYLSARELSDMNRWSVILGDPKNRVLPTDPHMIESIDPRPTGAPHPLLDEVVIAANTETANVNPINGHEQVADPARRDDLQFACIFPLETPVVCDSVNASSCDCNMEEYSKNSPICSFPGANLEGTQVYAKAYPGLRQLEVLKGIGDQALVASICPKNISAVGVPVLDPDYGYNPAIGGILNRLREGIGPTCIEKKLPVEDTPDGDQTICGVVEAHRDDVCVCDPELARLALDQDDPTRIDAIAQLEEDHQCGGTTGIGCDTFCLCEIRQLEGEDLTACQNDPEPPEGAFGFCFIDSEKSDVNPAIVRSCPGYAKRALRFAGDGTVTPGAFALLACPQDP